MTTPTVPKQTRPVIRIPFRDRVIIWGWQLLLLAVSLLAFCIRSPALLEWFLERINPKTFDAYLKIGHHD